MSQNIALRNALLGAYAGFFPDGVLTFYNGTPPATGEDALSGNTALVAHVFNGYNAASSGSMTAVAIDDEVIDVSGTCTFARLTKGTYVEQLTVGTSGAQVIVPTVTFTSGTTSSIVSITTTKAA